ncbi:MAG: MotA/TolQ/ExbB proton channel family protein [Rhodocyclaceae bacterium]|nr:MotA/TolQ/ExbB proton channel family protein [Rhodocyclaceae bacterium]
MNESLGFAHFLSQTDAVGRSVLCLLLALSVASWYLVLTKGLANLLAGRRAAAFLRQFWDAASLDEVSTMLAQRPLDNAFAALAQQAIGAADGSRPALQRLAAAGGADEFLTRVLRNGIDQEAARVEHGLTLMAMSGQGTLDKVAGPVGEALIMTALGLAVAIPAVLAYNAFNRRNRIWLAKLDAFAHDLYALMTVGAKANSSAGEVRQLRAVAPR